MTCKAARRLKAILARPAGLFREKARENLTASGGDKKSESAKSGLPNSTKAISPVNTRKEIAKIAGLGIIACRPLTPPQLRQHDQGAEGTGGNPL